MDEWVKALINIGFGGVVVLALIWFLYYLVKETLPQQQRSFTVELKAERDQRTKDTGELLQKLDALIARLGRFQETTLDRIDYGFKELINEIMEARGGKQTRWNPPPAPPEDAGKPK